MTTEQRFWAKVKKTDSCWLWTASTRTKGYGAFSYTRDGKMIQDRAHRYSWEIHKGPIPEGLWVLHNCPGGDNPACVNPAHLFLGTNQDNVDDMMSKGRHVAGGTYCIGDHLGNYERGEAHHGAILNPALVRAIRAAYANGMSYSQIANQFNIGQTTAFKVVKRRTWAHVE